jgi:aspartate racemase
MTMELDFYKSRLRGKNIEALVPEKDDRDFIHHTIWNELLLEKFRPQSKKRFLEIIKQLQGKGAEAVILGCTEIPLLIKQEDIDLPLFDTLKIHAHAAVGFALG